MITLHRLSDGRETILTLSTNGILSVEMDELFMLGVTYVQNSKEIELPYVDNYKYEICVWLSSP